MYTVPLVIFTVSFLGFLLGVAPSKIKLNQGKEDFIFIFCGSIFVGYTLSHLVHTLEYPLSILKISLILLGLLSMKFLNHFFFKRHICCSNGFISTEWGLLSLTSISLCSINDGLFLYLSETSLLSLLLLSVLVHKLTTSFLIARVIYTCQIHYNIRRTLGILILIATPLTYLVSHFLLQRTKEQSTLTSFYEYLLSFSLGILLYVTLSGIIPRFPRYMKKRKLQLFFGFILFVIALVSGSFH